MAILLGNPRTGRLGNLNYTPEIQAAVNEGLAGVAVAADGLRVTLGFNEPQNLGLEGLAGFDLTGKALVYLSGDGTSNITAQAETPIYSGESLTLSYNAENGDVQDDEGTTLDSVQNFAVTNNSVQTPPQPGSSSGTQTLSLFPPLFSEIV